MSSDRTPAVDQEKQWSPAPSTTSLLNDDITQLDNNDQLLLPLALQKDFSASPSLRGRSRTWGTIAVKGVVGQAAVPVAGIPIVGTTKDDLYINGVGLRRTFASEFLANLEVSALTGCVAFCVLCFVFVFSNGPGWVAPVMLWERTLA